MHSSVVLISAAGPYYNVTTANPPAPTTISGSCRSNCKYVYGGEQAYGWSHIFIVTVSHAIEYHIVNNRTNNTRTWTSYFEGQSSVSKPKLPTNSAGTRTYDITISMPTGAVGGWTTFVTTIAYPSRYTAYPYGYTWWGELATTDSSGASVCSWAPYYFSANNTRITTLYRAGGTMSGPSTDYSLVASGAYVPFLTLDPIGKDTQEIDPEDPGGINWIFDSKGWHSPSFSTMPPPYGHDAAWKLCKNEGRPDPPSPDWWNPPERLTTRPAEALASREYLTFTSTLHEDFSESVSSSASILTKASPVSESPEQPTASQTSRHQSDTTTTSPTETKKQSPTTTTTTTLPVPQVQSSDEFFPSSSLSRTSYSPPSPPSTLIVAPPSFSQDGPSFSTLPAAPSSSSPLASGTVGAAEGSGAGTASSSSSSSTPTAIVVGPATLSQIANAAVTSSFLGDLSRAASSDASPPSTTDSTSRSSGAVVAIIGGQTLSSVGQTVTLSGGNDATGASSEAVGASTQQEEQHPAVAVLQTDSAGHTQLLVGGSTVVSDVQGAYATGAATVEAMDGVLTGTTAAVTSAADTVQGQGQGQGQGRGTTTTVGGQSVEAANSTGAGEVETSASSTSGGQTVQASATSKTVSVQTESESKTTTSAPGSSDGADSGVATAGGVASEASAAAGVVVGQTVFGSLIRCWWVLVLL